MRTLTQFLQTDYEMPLSYDLIMEAYRSLQLGRDYSLTIVHAAAAVEVHVLHLLHGVLVASGDTPADAWAKLENDPEYEGVSKRLKRLETHTKSYCEQTGCPMLLLSVTRFTTDGRGLSQENGTVLFMPEPQGLPGMKQRK